MNSKFLHIIINFPVKLSFFEKNRQIFSVTSNQIVGDELDLKIESFEDLKIYVYPSSKNFLPYSLTFSEKENKSFLLSNFANFFALPENNYILILKEIVTTRDNIVGDQIELTKSEVKKLTFLNDIKGRGKVETFSVLNNNLIKKEKYFVFLNKNQQKLSNNLILLDFFQSIFAEDFSSASNHLSPNIGSLLNKETIKTFFGEFSSCKIINYFSQPAVALFYEDQIKVFGAKLENNKICDIYEIN